MRRGAELNERDEPLCSRPPETVEERAGTIRLDDGLVIVWQDEPEVCLNRLPRYDARWVLGWRYEVDE
jgi:hypothetical protein